jgi:6-phosphogluconate dehydrogenase
MTVTTKNMHVGLICPCPMGNNLTRLLRKHGHECHVFNCASVEASERYDQSSTDWSLEAFVQQLPKPRIVWVMVPTSGEFRSLVERLLTLLEPGDIVVDNKNFYCQASEYCVESLKQRGIRYVDVGTSTGASSVKRGYCLMIGGDPEAVQYLEPIFEALALVPKNKAVSTKSNVSNLKRKRYKVKPTFTHLYCGEAGAGHLARQFYEGTEQSLMRAYAEVLAERDRPSTGIPIST